jgi:hypothetical protein
MAWAMQHFPVLRKLLVQQKQVRNESNFKSQAMAPDDASKRQRKRTVILLGNP